MSGPDVHRRGMWGAAAGDPGVWTVPGVRRARRSHVSRRSPLGSGSAGSFGYRPRDYIRDAFELAIAVVIFIAMCAVAAPPGA